MDKANYSLMMEVFTQDNGKITKCMDMENFIIKMDRWPMKEIGKMINFQVSAGFLTIGLKKY